MRSPIPPIGEMIASDRTRRGPVINPSWIASRKPASSPQPSRTAVCPDPRTGPAPAPARAPTVPYRRVARRPDLAHHPRRPELPGALRLVEPPASHELVAVEREVVVTVDEAGQYGEARGVDHLGVGWPAGTRAGRGHRLDPSVVDQHGGVSHGWSPRAIDERAGAKNLHFVPPGLAVPTKTLAFLVEGASV